MSKVLTNHKNLVFILLIISLYTFTPYLVRADSGTKELINLFLKLQKTSSDTAKISVMLEIHQRYMNINADSSLVYAKMAYRLSKSANKYIIRTAKTLGVAYNMAGDYANSIKYEIEALTTSQAMHDLRSSAIILNNIGTNYLFLNELDKAFEYFNKASEASMDYKGKISALVNLGQVFASSERYSQAHDSYNKGLLMAQKEHNTKDEAIIYNRIGELYLMEANYTKSLYFLNKSLSLLDDKDLYYKIDGLKCMSEDYLLTGRYDMGIKTAKRADSLARKNGFVYELKMINSLISELYDSLRKPDLSLIYYKNYAFFKDSIFNIEKNNRMHFLQTEFETRQKEMQVEQLQKEAGFHRKMNYVYLIVGFTILLALFFFIKNIRQKNKILHFEKEKLIQQKERERLEKQNLELKLDEKHREILTHAIQINQQKEVLTSVQEEISNIIQLGKPDIIIDSVKQLNAAIKSKLDLSDDWDQIKVHFEKVHPEFFIRIKDDYPDLTVNDLKLCAYSKLKFSNKEIGRLLNINTSSVQVSRYRLKRKMNLPEEINFDDFVHGL